MARSCGCKVSLMVLVMGSLCLCMGASHDSTSRREVLGAVREVPGTVWESQKHAGAATRPDAETGEQAQRDIDNYFAEQTDENIIKESESYRQNHADEMEFNHLPCHGGAGVSFKLACESVSFHVRNRGRVVQNPSFPVHQGHQKEQQYFDEAYAPEQSRHLDISKDSSFKAEPSKTFDLNYADGSHLRGFTGNSMVGIGDYSAQAPFGVLTDCNSPDFNGVDGILGFGLPFGRNNMPRPILFAITAANKELPLKFSFYSTNTDAEVVLGGYDPASIKGTMWYIPAMATNDFIVGVTSMKFGENAGSAVELLKFKSDASRKLGMPAVLDSGTSCLVIPGDRAGGALKNVPWDDFARNWKKHKHFFLEIGQKSWKIPFESWFLADTEQTCVQPGPDGLEGILIGDVFFREYVVEFDMTGKRPNLGFAPLNKAYKPPKKNKLIEVDGYAAPKSITVTKGGQVMYPAEHLETLIKIDRIPIVNQFGTQYFMDVTVGTPKQKFTVIFDTGSSVFGVFSYKNNLPKEIKDKLPKYFFTQNLVGPVAALQVGMSSGPAALLGAYGTSSAGYAVLVGVNCAMLLGVFALVRRRRMSAYVSV